MTSPSTNLTTAIPILLLKTRSQPDDTYEELFSRVEPDNQIPEQFSFSPTFIPVLEHTQNAETLSHLGELLRTGELKRKYGGMIFTSQRAVEAWSDTVREVERSEPLPNTGSRSSSSPSTDDAFADLESLTPFPLYVVGPATERALQTLSNETIKNNNSNPNSPYTRLNTSIHGAHTGNGANLAEFMLMHYNKLHAEHWFTYYEAPRLPFIPLLGMSSQNYGRKRLEKDDPRLRKRPLLFLVGEVRRDIIPRTLMGQEEREVGGRRIEVEEVEVYRTEVMGGFGAELENVCRGLNREDQRSGVRVVVVFSPQGSDVMLRSIGYLDGQGGLTEQARNRWWHKNRDEDSGRSDRRRWIVVTIGPTTRDYLKDKLGVEPDASAAKPSPEGLKEAIESFLRENNVQI